MKKYDYLIVGAGLFGAVFAHEARKAGKSVLVIDKRPNIAGNVYTEEIEKIHVHKYGAHIFHTSNKEVWDYLDGNGFHLMTTMYTDLVNNYGKSSSIDEFAQLMKLGRTVFYRKLRGVTGYSPNEYLRGVRMKIAAELLLSCENLTVAEVAYKVGISDPFYFSKCFKTQFGVAPSVYQRGEMKEQGENEFLGTCNYFRSSATEFQTLLAKTGILSDPVFSRLSGNQGYRLTEQLNNVPDTEITGTIQNEKQNIIKQYESYLPTSSWSPGSISKSFSSEEDALAYIGYKNLRSFALPQKAESISVNANADKNGNICYISLSELYSCADGQINVTAAADLYTESSNTGSYIDMDYPSYEETPDAVSTSELYTTASGDTWQLITTTSQSDDFNDSIDAYRTEDTILYGIHIGYPSSLKESAQAELKKILENGIGQN